jgi:hypothetical protein
MEAIERGHTSCHFITANEEQVAEFQAETDIPRFFCFLLHLQILETFSLV